MGWQITLSLFFLCKFAFSMPQDSQKIEDLRATGLWRPNATNEECGKRTIITNIVGKDFSCSEYRIGPEPLLPAGR